MSALHDAQKQGANIDIGFLNVFFWNWYAEHREDRIVKLNVFIFSVTVKVKHLDPLFSMLFGPKDGPLV